MKKCFSVMLVMILLFLFSFSVFAAGWPPDEYEMPRVVISGEQVKDSLSGLKTTIRSCANIGLVILGILTSVFLIPRIFRRIFLGGLDSAGHSDGHSDKAYRETKF